MTATPDERALAEDITTPAAKLQELAAAHPDLWPAIAAHPNVYPDLLAWMQEYGALVAPAGTAPVATVGTGAPSTAGPAIGTASPAGEAGAASAASAPRTPSVPRGRLFAWIGGGVAAIIVAIVLVMTLVVTPMQRAAEEAAAAEAEAEALRASLVSSFEQAAKDCTQANKDYTSALSQANTQLTTDPSSMADPTVLDALREQIAELGDVESCVAPTEMSEDNEELKKQTSGIRSEVVRVQTATTGLNTSASAVRRSVQEVLDAAAAAAAEEQRQQDAAKLASRTWTMTDAQGYSFTASLSAAAPTTTFTAGDRTLGDSCGFDPTTDMAIPVTLTVTATTQGFDTNISALVNLTLGRGYTTPHVVVVEAYYSDSSNCASSTTSAGTFIMSSVKWPEPFASGTSSTHRFVVIIRDWRTPATPNGDLAFLDHVMLSVKGGQNSGYSGQSKTVALSGLR